MIPQGYAAAMYAWAISPELSVTEKADRAQLLLDERDALITGALNGGKGVREMVSGSANGKTFSFDPTISKAEKLVLLNDVLERLGLVAAEAAPVTSTHAVFPCLQR